MIKGVGDVVGLARAKKWEINGYGDNNQPRWRQRRSTHTHSLTMVGWLTGENLRHNVFHRHFFSFCIFRLRFGFPSIFSTRQTFQSIEIPSRLPHTYKRTARTDKEQYNTTQQNSKKVNNTNARTLKIWFAMVLRLHKMTFSIVSVIFSLSFHLSSISAIRRAVSCGRAATKKMDKKRFFATLRVLDYFTFSFQLFVEPLCRSQHGTRT